MLTFPPAKINLGLYVVEKRPDGYHNLETVFYPIPLCDTLETKPLLHSNAPYAFQQVGLRIDGEAADNLVVRVYLSMKEEFGLPALDIYMDKHIPTGAGLGGGSSDAAHMMKQLNEQFGLGMKTTVELLTEKNNLQSAQQQLLQAKYMAVLNKALLRFYAGEKFRL